MPLRRGIGAKCSVLVKFLHPNKLVKDVIKNPTKGQKEFDLIIVRRDEKVVNRRKQTVVVLRSDDTKWRNEEVYCCERYATVLKEGDVADIFTDTRSANERGSTGNDPSAEFEGVPVPDNVRHSTSNREDIINLRNQGFEVDDDNDPVAENIPDTSVDVGDKPVYKDWGCNGIDPRKVDGCDTNRQAKIKKSGSQQLTFTGWFLLFFPSDYVTDIILPNTNKSLDIKLSLGEFLRYVGIWLFITNHSLKHRVRDFWSKETPSRFSSTPAYRCDDWMSHRRFKEITKALTFTGDNPPTYKDPFHEVRGLIKAWNANMTEVFQPSWLSCLDESISIWFSKFTCPGWMCVPRKPHPFGNEYHSICCANSKIMYQIELVEGKDEPKEKPDPEFFDKKSPTTGLLLRLCKPIFGHGMIVALDSGFCVLKSLLRLKELGVYAIATIKKRRYWPWGVDGDALALHFLTSAVGDSDLIMGSYNSVDFKLICLNEPKYVSKYMATFGSLALANTESEEFRILQDGSKKKFKLIEPLFFHKMAKHCVDDHNHLRQQLPALETTWKTSWWPNRVFAFLLAITEINIFCAYKYFFWSHTKDQEGYEEPTVFSFRNILAEALINNEILEKEKAAGDNIKRASKRLKKQAVEEHKLFTAPPYAKYFNGRTFVCKAVKKYQQYVCRSKGCKTYIRTYCVCSPGVWICQECFVRHANGSAMIE